MRRVVRLTAGLSLLGAGYVLGSLQVGGPSFLRAEPQSPSQSQSEGIPDSVKNKLREANRALADAIQALVEEKRYVPAIQGVNSFAVSVGGLDAIADLESGHGVDPETFAGLVSGQALPEVAENLARDAEGRLTYKSKSIRLYSPTRLKQLFALRAEFLPVASPTPSATAKKTTAKKTSETEEKSE